MIDDRGSPNGAGEWESLDRRVRVAYDATPPRSRHVLRTPFPQTRPRDGWRSRGRWGVAVGAATAAAVMFLVARAGPGDVGRDAVAEGPVVSFALAAPGAHQVAVVGDFNEWNPRASPLARTRGGEWRLRLAVQPGRHEYAFVVDDRWVTDPLAPKAADVGFGRPNSVVLAARVRQ